MRKNKKGYCSRCGEFVDDLSYHQLCRSCYTELYGNMGIDEIFLNPEYKVGLLFQ